MSQGLMTIAYGPKKYIRMARALALSYRRLHPTLPMAIVTDKANAAEMSAYFDQVIPYNPAYGSGVVQKLHADLYSPYDETLFVNSDCIFYKSPERLWNLYAGKPFSVRGWRYLTGKSDYERQNPYEWVRNTSDFLRRNGIARLPHFNSGVFFFTKEPLAAKLFEEARTVYEKRDSLGFVSFKNAPIADEPAFAVAMEHCGIEMDPWDSNNGMQTAINMQSGHSINVLKGLARFRKSNVESDPVLVHYNVNAQYSLIYNREVCRLEFENARFGSLHTAVALTTRMTSAIGERTRSLVLRLPSRVKEKGIGGIVGTLRRRLAST
ncbi:hypothetical protein LMIY3S_00441 [Labrys miyagiensis]